jgi:hypothetical protein
MNLLFVNPLAPDAGVIGAMRLWRFAEELSGRGHRVLYLCARDEERGTTLDFESHDWSRPFVLAVGPSAERCLERRGLAAVAGRAYTLAEIVLLRGPLWRWRRNMESYARLISERFAPDVCIGCFGSLDSLNVAQAVARARSAPWIMDIKDPANRFLHWAIRSYVGGRYRDAARVTLNSEFQRANNDGWPVERARVIYSGAAGLGFPGRGPVLPTTYALVGSIYSDNRARELLASFSAWRRQRAAEEALIVYMGTDAERVARIATSLGPDCPVEIAGQLPHDQFLERCASMAASMYIASENTFHHKSLELLVLGRPVIAYPGEGAEMKRLAEINRLPLWCAPDAAALERAWGAAPGTPSNPDRQAADALSWSRFAAEFEEEVLAATSSS